MLIRPAIDSSNPRSFDTWVRDAVMPGVKSKCKLHLISYSWF